MAGVEIGVEAAAADDGTLGDEVGNAHPAVGIVHVHIGTGVAALEAGVGGVFHDAGPEHALALLAHPLVAVLLGGGNALAVTGGVQTLQATVVAVGAAEQGVAGSGVAGGIVEVGHAGGTVMVAAEAGLVALDAVEDLRMGIRTDGLGVAQLAVDAGEAGVVDEDGIVDLAVGLILQPCGLGGIEGGVGIIPLGIQTLGGQVGHEGLEALVVALLLVQEIAVKAVVFGHFHQLFGDDINLAVLFRQHVGAGLAGTEGGIEVDAGDGHNTVPMGGVGVGGVRNVDDAELEASGPPVAGGRIIQSLGGVGRSRTVPGGEIVGVLPEGHDILGELIGIHGAAEEAVAIVAGHVHDLGIGGQVGLGLGGGESLIAVKQRHIGHQELRVGVRRRVPVFDVLDAVSGEGGLRRGRVVGPGIRLGGDHQSRCGGDQHHKCQQCRTQSFEFTLAHTLAPFSGLPCFLFIFTYVQNFRHPYFVRIAQK